LKEFLNIFKPKTNTITMKKIYKNRKSGLAFLVFLSLSLAASAQDRSISGTVKDEVGNPMPGVNVIVKGTASGTATDGDGKFTLSVPANATLVFTFVGYTTSEIPVGSQTVLDVKMALDATMLSEIVVTGYAAQDKKDLTGSVGVVKASELTQIPSSNIASQLQGRVAGVTVSGDGRPGQPAKVRIRGFGSFENNDPLYVVDGIPTQDISTVNPNDIESMSVLKDAGAASIYGSRASNGVVVITTKRGVSSGVRVSYNMYLGTQDPGKSPDFLLSTQEFADLQWLVYKNDRFDGTVDADGDGNLDQETHPVYGPSSNSAPTFPSWAGNTDWYKTITQNARIMNHDISLSGGNENAKFYAGLNYFDQEGIVITNFSKRFSARINSEFKVKNRVTIGQNLTVTGRTGNQVSGNGTEGSPVSRVYMIQPIIPARVGENIAGISHNYIPGEYGGTGIAARLGNGPNALADLERNKDDRNQDLRILGNAFMDIKIVDALTFRTTFGGTYQSNYNTDWNSATYERSENIATASYYETANYRSDWVWTNALTFSKTFDAHKVLAVAGYEAVKYGIGRELTAARAGYYSDAFSYRTVSNGAQNLSPTSSFNTPTTLVSMFLRADYSFSDKYLLGATVRRDGSSRFGSNNRYGVFPSVSVGWRLSEESFLAGVDFISDMKIRGGYGTMGNQLAIASGNEFFLYGGGTGESNYDLNGSGSGSLQGFRPTRIGNPDAKWETNVTTNVGFDAGILNNKFQLTFDWYSKQTKDLLYALPLDGTRGAAQQPYVNISEMKNTGIDVQLTYKQNFSADLSFEGNLTFTTYKNEIVKVADGTDNYFAPAFYDTRIGTFTRNEVGHPMSSFYGYQVSGLFQSDSEATASGQDGAEAGFFRYADLNGDGAITPNDRTFIGNPNPKFTYGLNLTVRYRDFDVTGFFYGSQGNDIFNYNKWWLDFWPSFQNQKSKELLYNSWTPTNTGASVPKASNKSNFSTNTQSISYYIEDGSFMRLKNLQFGYNMPKALTSKIGLTNARIYLQGVNLFTISKYSGIDPDVNSGDDRSFGVDHGNYPLVKTYTLGVNIGF
jgi:TonB-dependent starch-binding outer membrane protein SusC